jgi:hypothetical protein
VHIVKAGDLLLNEAALALGGKWVVAAESETFEEHRPAFRVKPIAVEGEVAGGQAGAKVCVGQRLGFHLV